MPYTTRNARHAKVIMVMFFMLEITVSHVSHAQTAGASATSYTIARTDSAVTQPSVPTDPATWGGAIGAGNKWCNPAYNNTCIWRLTDANTFKNQQSVNSVETGAERIISPSERYVIVTAVAGDQRIINFSKKLSTATPVGTQFAGRFNFPASSDMTAYGLVGTQILKATTANGWVSVTTSLVYDFKSCLPTGFAETWHGAWDIPRGSAFGVAFSDQGAQGTGEYVVAYKGGDCSLLNTQTGQVFENGTLLGTVDDGSSPLADRFTLHEAGWTANPSYMTVGAANCLIGNCQYDSPYYWQVGTTHLRPTFGTSGHYGRGYWNAGFLHNVMLSRWDEPAQPHKALFPNYPRDVGDEHGSWANAPVSPGPDDQVPMFVVSTHNAMPTQYTVPYQGEIYAVSASGNGPIWRFGQTGATGNSGLYVCDNALMEATMTGDGVVFASDMGGIGALGYDAHGNPRCDVFFMEAK